MYKTWRIYIFGTYCTSGDTLAVIGTTNLGTFFTETGGTESGLFGEIQPFFHILFELLLKNKEERNVTGQFIHVLLYINLFTHCKQGGFLITYALIANQ